MINFISNSAAYVSSSSDLEKGRKAKACQQSDPNDPTKIQDFGHNGIPREVIPFLHGEKTDANDGSRIASWPSSNLTAIGDGTKGVFIASIAFIAPNGAGTDLYSSLMTVTAEPDGPKFERTIPQLFYPDKGMILYGNFGVCTSPDGYLLTFGKTEKGICVARVPVDCYLDIPKWTYWTGREWSAAPPSPDSKTAELFDGLYSSGDIFYSAHHKTYLAIYMTGWGDSTFYIRYSLSGKVEGPWSDDHELLKTEPSKKVFNYAGHAYPDYHKTCKKVVLSWCRDGGEIHMAEVEFE